MVDFFGNYTVNVHLNVPEHKGQHPQYLRKFKWLLLGLFAPELVAYVAWQQRQEAAKLSVEIDEIYHPRQSKDEISGERMEHGIEQRQSDFVRPDEQRDERGTHRRQPRWGLVHGFFALMGGFCFNVTTAENRFLPGDITRASLTPDGLRFLVQHEPNSLPRVTIEEIKDKSKADGLKKTLVCAQALWFCVQCIARASKSLPVSLLELNTLGHALCTLVIYLLWWHKPLNIEEPVLIEDSDTRPIFAYMWMSSRISASDCSSYDMPDGLQDEFHCIWPFSKPVLLDLCDSVTYWQELGAKFMSKPTPTHAPQSPAPEEQPGSDPGDLENNLGQSLGRIGPCEFPEPSPHAIDHRHQHMLMENHNYRNNSRPAYISATYKVQSRVRNFFAANEAAHRGPAGLGTRMTAISHFSAEDIARRRLALEAIVRYDLEGDLRSRHNTATSGRSFIKALNIRIPFIDAVRNNLLNPRVELRARNAVATIAPSGIFQGFAVSGALYGGLHLAAWAAPFPSSLEGLLWKISAISVTCTGLCLLIVAMIGNTKSCRLILADISSIMARRPLRYPSRGQKLVAYVTATGISLLGCIIASCLPFSWILYLLSRGFLVVESFKDVAYLPAASFETPNWSSYVPHIA
ncbi:MAG: hypothetical protein LQ350_004439 [Teloschistes chrysophthalmus]|nr:MAG: hypothetical protein LQ350_004439 [Niorma chrysophthalma]